MYQQSINIATYISCKGVQIDVAKNSWIYIIVANSVCSCFNTNWYLLVSTELYVFCWNEKGLLKFVVINEYQASLILYYHLHVFKNFTQYLRVDARVIVIAITNVKSFILLSICYSSGKIYSKQDFDFLLLFDVKMYYYCEIIMYNIFCSIKNQLHISSIASRGQKFVLPRNTCIFPRNKLFLYHAELHTTSLLPKNQGCQTFTFNNSTFWYLVSILIHFNYGEVDARCLAHLKPRL